MKSKPDYNSLYETAESQAGDCSAEEAGQQGFSWERLSDNVKNGRFHRLFRLGTWSNGHGAPSCYCLGCCTLLQSVFRLCRVSRIV